MDLALPLHVGRLRATVLHSDRTGLKEQLFRGLWLTQAGGRERYRMWGEPVAAEAGVTWHQPEARVCSPREVVPGSRNPGSGGLHRLPGGAVWRVTCAHTQASWWQQQQPQHLMPVCEVHADSHGLRPSRVRLSGTLNPSPCAPQNKEGRKSLLSLWQLQTFSWTPSWLAVVH